MFLIASNLLLLLHRDEFSSAKSYITERSKFGPLSKIQQAFGGGSKPTPKPDSDKVEAVPVPQDEAECDRLISQFERGAEGLRGDENVSDSVAQHVLGDSTSLLDEQWLGTPEEEKAA